MSGMAPYVTLNLLLEGGGMGPGIVEEMGEVQSLAQVEGGGWELIVRASEILGGVKVSNTFLGDLQITCSIYQNTNALEGATCPSHMLPCIPSLIPPRPPPPPLQLGDSIAVNGTCLTVTAFDSASFKVGAFVERMRISVCDDIIPLCDDVIIFGFTGLAPETLRKTSLGEVVSGSPVNLERSLLPDTRMGGHFVQVGEGGSHWWKETCGVFSSIGPHRLALTSR